MAEPKTPAPAKVAKPTLGAEVTSAIAEAIKAKDHARHAQLVRVENALAQLKHATRGLDHPIAEQIAAL